MTEPRILLPYLTPRERAVERAKAEAIDAGIMLAIILLGMAVAFLEAGQFTGEAWRAFAVAVAVTVGKSLVSVLTHLRRARAEAATDPAQ